MFYYDLRCHDNKTTGENTDEELIKMAKKLNLAGIGIIRTFSVNDNIKNITWPSDTEIDIVKTLLIQPKNPEELNKIVNKVREHVEVIIVDGGDLAVNRAACETSAVDVLANPEKDRRDSGLDHIMVKLARDNKVAIEVNLHTIIESYRKHRVYKLTSMKRNVFLCNKYNTPVITTSAAVSKWHMRSGRQLASLTNLLGMELIDAVKSITSVPESIIEKNRKKLKGESVEGAEEVK